MELKLEVVVVPVTDIDRAKRFYVEQLGFNLDVDAQPTEAMRVVQLTPPGSGCSVVIGPLVVPPDTDFDRTGRFQLVVNDLDTARAQLVDRGVEVSDVHVLDPRDGGKFVFFKDPDGNNWAIQEIRERPGAELG